MREQLLVVTTRLLVEDVDLPLLSQICVSAWLYSMLYTESMLIQSLTQANVSTHSLIHSLTLSQS